MVSPSHCAEDKLNTSRRHLNQSCAQVREPQTFDDKSLELENGHGSVTVQENKGAEPFDSPLSTLHWESWKILQT